MRDQADAAAVSDFDAGSSGDSPSTKGLRWWPLVLLAIASWGFASWLVFIWLGIRTRTRQWFVVAGVSAASVALAFFVAAGTGPNSASSSVAASVSVANWVGATISVLIVRRRSVRPLQLAEPARWRTFNFFGPIDVAWERLTTDLAPMGGAVTSEDFHTFLVKWRSRSVDVEFHMTLSPGPTDATSASLGEPAASPALPVLGRPFMGLGGCARSSLKDGQRHCAVGLHASTTAAAPGRGVCASHRRVPRRIEGLQRPPGG